MASIVDFIMPYLVAGRKTSNPCSVKVLCCIQWGRQDECVCLILQTGNSQSVLKDIKHASIQRWCGAKANV